MYNLFISHSWSYSDQYKGLINLLSQDSNFEFKDYSVPKDDPIHNASNQDALREAIRAQMQHASCVIVLAGVYSSYSKWINIEIDLAKEMGKRIIAVEGWGAERTSMMVKDNAVQTVKWNTKSIIDAIKGF